MFIFEPMRKSKNQDLFGKKKLQTLQKDCKNMISSKFSKRAKNHKFHV